MPHSAMSPAPMNTWGVPGASTMTVVVSWPVSPVEERPVRLTAYCPTAAWVWLTVIFPLEPTSPLSTEASPHDRIQRYELGFSPGGATRAVSETAWPVVARRSAPTSTVGAGGGGGGPSLDLQVAVQTASVATDANIVTRSYCMSPFPGPARLGLREPRGGRKTGSGHRCGRRW